MTHAMWNPFAGSLMAPEQRPPPPATVSSDGSVRGQLSVASEGPCPTEVGYDSTSFSAGQDSGTRVAACVARLAALELTAHSRWWNRWKHRLMARALVACAEEMECAADEGRV